MAIRLDQNAILEIEDQMDLVSGMFHPPQFGKRQCSANKNIKSYYGGHYLQSCSSNARIKTPPQEICLTTFRATM